MRVKDISNRRARAGSREFGVRFRPGGATVRYIENVINRLTLPGAVFLAAIAIGPTLLFSVTEVPLLQAFGGTSILIMVGVALETMTQLESQLKMRHYEGFLKKSKSRSVTRQRVSGSDSSAFSRSPS